MIDLQAPDFTSGASFPTMCGGHGARLGAVLKFCAKYLRCAVLLRGGNQKTCRDLLVSL